LQSCKCRNVCVCVFRPRCGIDEGNLEWLEQLFRQTVGNEKEIRRDDFKKIVMSKNVSPWTSKIVGPVQILCFLPSFTGII
jgi:hypothetical protein